VIFDVGLGIGLQQFALASILATPFGLGFDLDPGLKVPVLASFSASEVIASFNVTECMPV